MLNIFILCYYCYDSSSCIIVYMAVFILLSAILLLSVCFNVVI